MSRTRCFVQLVDGKIVRIFKGRPTNAELASETVLEWPKKDALDAITKQVMERANYRCELCGDPARDRHEKKLRSLGGQISMDNCQALCRDCHTNVAHGDRRPRWSK